MADYYVLELNSKKDALTVVYHIAIPGAATNFNGMTYRDALVEKSIKDTGDVPVSVLPDTFGGVSVATEKADVTSGAVYEIVKIIEMDANLSNANKKAVLDADFAATEANIQAAIQDRLTFWGYQETLA